MTEPLAVFRREDFELLLDEHRRIIELANEVEFHLHALAGGASADTVQALQESAGSLLTGLRGYLFRLDQQVLPIVDAASQQPQRAGGET